MWILGADENLLCIKSVIGFIVQPIHRVILTHGDRLLDTDSLDILGFYESRGLSLMSAFCTKCWKCSTVHYNQKRWSHRHTFNPSPAL